MPPPPLAARLPSTVTVGASRRIAPPLAPPPLPLTLLVPLAPALMPPNARTVMLCPATIWIAPPAYERAPETPPAEPPTSGEMAALP